MLIYNYKKDFIGIDDKDLKVFGLDNLAQLRSEAADFADLFVKTPGYIHNFKHVHWIDYIECADAGEQPKAVINVNSKLFKADLFLNIAYLADEPTQKAYIVNLQNLRELTNAERNAISADALKMQPTPASNDDTVNFQAPSSPTELAQQAVEDEYDNLELPEETTAQTEQITIEEPNLDVFEDDTSLDIEESILMDETASEEETLTQTEPETNYYNPPSSEVTQKVLESDYVYDPHIASEELGLPLDLIEEFIQDFITQAKEFKEGLYTALDNGDIDNVKILSHKLKGVAANLRIEDALETLTTINTTSDLDVMRENLDIFYLIIAKLAGEEIADNTPSTTQGDEIVINENDDDNIDISFEDETDTALEITANADDDKIEISLDDTDTIEEEISIQEEIPLEEENDSSTSNEEDKIELSLDTDDDAPLEITLDDEEEVELESDDTQTTTPEEIQVPQEETENEEALDVVQETQNESTPYDMHAAAEAIGIDLESFQELLEDFKTEANEIVSAMHAATANNDLDLIHEKALQLKGMSENMRYSALSAEVEKLIDIEDIHIAQEHIQRVQQLLEEISN